jgi:hypothetical protein
MPYKSDTTYVVSCTTSSLHGGILSIGVSFEAGLEGAMDLGEQSVSDPSSSDDYGFGDR